MDTPNNNIPVPSTVTPLNTSHSLFGKVLTVIKQDAEYVYAELKDGVHWIEARFRHSEYTAVSKSSDPTATTTVTTTTPPAA